MRWPMLEPYAGKPARTVLRGLGGPQGLPGYPTLSSNPLRRLFNGLGTTWIVVDVAWRILNLLRRSLFAWQAGPMRGLQSGLQSRISGRAATPTSWCAARPPPET